MPVGGGTLHAQLFSYAGPIMAGPAQPRSRMFAIETTGAENMSGRFDDYS
jgi:hypothetical protein